MTENEEKRCITSGCCQWRGSASYDSDVHIETYVLRGKVGAENRHRTATANPLPPSVKTEKTIN